MKEILSECKTLLFAAGWKERGLVSEKELFALLPKEAVNSGDISRDLIELNTPNKSQPSIKQCAAKTGVVVWGWERSLHIWGESVRGLTTEHFIIELRKSFTFESKKYLWITNFECCWKVVVNVFKNINVGSWHIHKLFRDSASNYWPTYAIFDLKYIVLMNRIWNVSFGWKLSIMIIYYFEITEYQKIVNIVNISYFILEMFLIKI